MSLPSRRVVLGFGLTGLAAATVPESVEADGFLRRERCSGRSAYVGASLRYPLRAGVLPEARASAQRPLRQVILDPVDDVFDRRVPHGGSAVVAGALAGADGVAWNQIRGARRGDEPERFVWPGAEELCLATVILQLCAEGRLSLDDRVSRFARAAPAARHMRVEDLLAHTSGLGPSGTTAACPGGQWERSGENGRLIVQIIEAVDGRQLAQCLEARLAKPLGLDAIRFATPGSLLPERLAAPGGYIPAPGEPMASAQDMIRLWRGMLGPLSAPAQLEQRFARLYPVGGAGGVFWGLGAMVMDRSRDVWLGIAGEAPGCACLIIYSARRQAFMALALVGAHAEGAPGLAEALLGVLPDASQAQRRPS